MGSASELGNRHEIVAKVDGHCWDCRGRTFKGSRILWEKDTSRVWHLVCPPVVKIAETVYRQPPVSPDLWKRYCKEIADVFCGRNTSRAVVDEDRKAYESGGYGALLASVMNRTRCTGAEAVEIGRRWIDELRKPVGA